MIEVNKAALHDALQFIMESIYCGDCPWLEECDKINQHSKTAQGCTAFAMECLQKKEEEYD